MNYHFVFKTTVIILLLTNISVTVYLSDKTFDSTCNEKNVTATQPGTTKTHFPKGLGESILTEIFFSISEAYSAKNFDKLVALLDPEVVSRFGQGNMLKELDKLYGIFGPIREGFFSNIFPVGNTDDKLYKISYDVGLSKASQVGQKAILLVTVKLDNSGYKIKGIFLNIPSDQKE